MAPDKFTPNYFKDGAKHKNGDIHLNSHFYIAPDFPNFGFLKNSHVLLTNEFPNLSHS